MSSCWLSLACAVEYAAKKMRYPGNQLHRYWHQVLHAELSAACSTAKSENYCIDFHWWSRSCIPLRLFLRCYPTMLLVIINAESGVDQRWAKHSMHNCNCCRWVSFHLHASAPCAAQPDTGCYVTASQDWVQTAALKASSQAHANPLNEMLPQHTSRYRPIWCYTTSYWRHLFNKSSSGDEISERDVTYHLMITYLPLNYK